MSKKKMKQRQIFDKYPHYFQNQVSPGIGTGSKSVSVSSLKQYFRSNPNNGNNASSWEFENDELMKAMKPLLILGRILLIIPYSKSGYSNLKHSRLRLELIPVLATILVIAWQCLALVLEFRFVYLSGTGGQLGALGYLSKSHFFFATCMELFTYISFLKNSAKFFRIFDKWSEMDVLVGLESDKWLQPLACLLSISSVFHLTLSAVFYYVVSNQSKFGLTSRPALERVFLTIMAPWRDIISYNPVFVAFSITLRLLLSGSRYLVPFMIIFFSRATSFQFKKLIQNSTGLDNLEDAHFVDLKFKSKQFWIDLVSKHRVICKLVKSINNFLSPFIFTWMAYNVYVLSMKLYRALLGTEKIEIPTYLFTISFGLETTIFLITIVSAAKVNTYAVRIINCLRNCPREFYYEAEVYRLEMQITTGPTIGFTGLGCFVITRRILLKVFNAIFTLEIVLLQSIQSGPTSNTEKVATEKGQSLGDKGITDAVE